MLDIKLMRKEPERVAQAVGRRGKEIDMQPFLTADEKHREVIAQIEELQSQRNAKSKEVGQRKRNGESADDLMAEVSAINEKIKVLDESKDALEKEVRDFVVSIPNMPADDIPDGGEDDYRVERVWGEPRKFDLNQRHTGISASISTFSISTVLQKSPAAASPSTKAWLPVSNARSFLS